MAAGVPVGVCRRTEDGAAAACNAALTLSCTGERAHWGMVRAVAAAAQGGAASLLLMPAECGVEPAWTGAGGCGAMGPTAGL